MQEYYYFNRPLPPPRPTAHLWLGVVLSGLSLGLGAFYVVELHQPRPIQIVTLDIDLLKGVGSPQSAEIQNLLTDVKELMGALRETQHALADAQTRIAALEQENRTLREAGAQASAPQASAPPADPATPSAATPPEQGVGGPLVRAPKPDTVPIAAPQSEPGRGPRACWMRSGSMIATYRITVRDDGFAFAPAWEDDSEGAWPAEFDQVMEGFRGTPLNAQALVSRADFKKIMRPYFNYGMKQEAHCRFLVSVTNQTSSKEAWQSGLALVERYFFKKIRGKSAGEVALRAER